jgi:hypothetical protein
MRNRRIVTGNSPAGKSIIVFDGQAPRTGNFKAVPGFSVAFHWETNQESRVPSAGDPTIASQSMLPDPGATSVLMVTFPPDSVMMSPDFDPAAAGAEYMQLLPGLAEKFEMDNPGMHTTDSVDYDVLIDGEMHLELDDGKSVQLAPGDLVVQNGTRHAWRNRSDKPATMLFVLVGVQRKR